MRPTSLYGETYPPMARPDTRSRTPPNAGLPIPALDQAYLKSLLDQVRLVPVELWRRGGDARDPDWGGRLPSPSASGEKERKGAEGYGN